MSYPSTARVRAGLLRPPAELRRHLFVNQGTFTRRCLLLPLLLRRRRCFDDGTPPLEPVIASAAPQRCCFWSDIRPEALTQPDRDEIVTPVFYGSSPLAIEVPEIQNNFADAAAAICDVAETGGRKAGRRGGVGGLRA